MFTKLFNSLFTHFPRYVNKNTIGYSTGTVVILYILSNFPPRPPNNGYLMRKY